MSAPLAFGPGEKVKGHNLPEARDRCALVLEYGKEAVRYVDASPCYAGAVGMIVSHRREFDLWYRRDDRTPPTKVAQIIYQHARRLGATPEAVQFLRQFVTISNEEAKTMTTIAENNAAAKPNFGAPAPKKSVAEAKPLKAAATKETATKAAAPKPAAAPKATKAAEPKAEKAKAAPAKKAEPKAAAEKKVQVVTYKKMPAKDVKIPPQARKILEVLKAKGPKLEKLALFKELEGEIVTKQGVDRVFAFYQKQLVTDGYMTVV